MVFKGYRGIRGINMDDKILKNTSEIIRGLEYLLRDNNFNQMEIEVIKEAIDDLKKFKRFKVGIRSLKKNYKMKGNKEGILGLAEHIYKNFAKELEAFEEIE